MTDAWYDDEAGPLVRPYAQRRHPVPMPGALDVADLLVAVDPAPALDLAGTRAAAVRLCAVATSVAEVAAHLGIDIGAARDLLAGLLGDGALTRCAPDAGTGGTGQDDAGQDDDDTFSSLLDGLRGL